MYMEAEHQRRKYAALWTNDIAKNMRTIEDCRKTIHALRDEIKHRDTMQTAQRRVIESLQDTMKKHGLPVRRIVASLSNCRAGNDEICPLSLMPINQSMAPFIPDPETIDPETLVINPMKPEHKCAELSCGHRFNSMWLIFYLVERNTFRCPVCRDGPSEFCFQKDELPPTVTKMLQMAKEAKNVPK